MLNKGGHSDLCHHLGGFPKSYAWLSGGRGGQKKPKICLYNMWTIPNQYTENIILRFIVFSFPKKSSGTVATAISCFLCIPGESVPAFCFVLSLCISVKVMVKAEKCLVSRILGETEMENAKAIFLMFFLRLTFCILHSYCIKELRPNSPFWTEKGFI